MKSKVWDRECGLKWCGVGQEEWFEMINDASSDITKTTGLYTLGQKRGRMPRVSEISETKQLYGCTVAESDESPVVLGSGSSVSLSISRGSL